MILKLMSSVLLCVICFASQVEAKALAEQGVAKIHGFYQDSVKRLYISGANIQDIEMACMGEIYMQWFYQYKNVIQQSDELHFSEISGYREAEQNAHLVENDRKIYDFMRSDLSNRILGEISDRRANGTWTKGPDVLTLEDPKDQDLLANFKDCRSEEFVNAIKSAYELEPGFLSEKIGIEITGYVPSFKDSETPHKVTGYYGAVEDKLTKHSATYEDWLYEIITR